MRTYKISFGSEKFDYVLLCDELEKLVENLQAIACDSYFFISDKMTASLYWQNIYSLMKLHERPCHLVEFEGGETRKNLDVLAEVISQLLEGKATRNSCIIALGGGVTGNIAGFAAALLFRGIRWVNVPTTAMAILDACLSLKQAVNFGKSKNVIGTFYAPDLVIGDVAFLRSLPPHQARSGICEVVKNFLTIDASEIEKLKSILNPMSDYTDEDYIYFIDHSIRSKTKVMKVDAKEKSTALILEYGHTVGHGIELASHGQVTHGDAIALGMKCAAEISHALGFLDAATVKLHFDLLNLVGTPSVIPFESSLDEIMKYVYFDNKRGHIMSRDNCLEMVLLKTLATPVLCEGKPLYPVPIPLIEEAIERRLRGETPEL